MDLLDKLIELSCKQGRWEETDRQTQLTTITLRPKGPRVKKHYTWFPTFSGDKVKSLAQQNRIKKNKFPPLPRVI